MGFPGKNTGVCCHAPLQGLLTTQELNPGLLHLQADFFFLTTETLEKPYAFWSSYLGEGVSMPQEDIFLVISMALQVIDIFSLVNSDFHLMDKASL